MTAGTDTAAIIGSPVGIEFQGVRHEFKPLDWEVIGQLCEELTERANKCIPTMEDLTLMCAAATSPEQFAAGTQAGLETLRRMRSDAANTNFDRVIDYVMLNDGLFDALQRCAVDENTGVGVIGQIVISGNVNPDVKSQIRRWLEVSGLVSAIKPGDTGSGDKGDGSEGKPA